MVAPNIQHAASRQIDFMASRAQSHAVNYNFYNIALLKEISPSREVIAVILKQHKKISKDCFRHILSPTPLLIKIADENQLDDIFFYLDVYNMIDKKPTFYICQNRSCSAPITDRKQLKKILSPTGELTTHL